MRITKKIILSLLLVFVSINLFSCKKDRYTNWLVEERVYLTLKRMDDIDPKEFGYDYYISYGRKKVLREFENVHYFLSDIIPDYGYLNISDEDLDYVNLNIGTDDYYLSTSDILNLGILTHDQEEKFLLYAKEEFKSSNYDNILYLFTRKLWTRPPFNLIIIRDLDGNDQILIESRGPVWDYLSFPLETINADIIIEGAKNASHKDNISRETLNHVNGGIFFHSYELVDNKPKLKFYFIDIDNQSIGNVYFFDILV
jgi:hypothetical protein